MQDTTIGRSVCEHETRLPVNSGNAFFYLCSRKNFASHVFFPDDRREDSDFMA
jgi:hypothetical protein